MISPAYRDTPGSPFRSQVLVRFADCDYARMVFYPRYLVMFNNLVEDWFATGLDLSFSELHAQLNWGIPTVHLEVDFRAPSFLGDVLQASLSVTSVGRSSFGLEIILNGPDGAERVRGQLVLVLMELGHNCAHAIPDNLRARMAKFMPAGVESSAGGE